MCPSNVRTHARRNLPQTKRVVGASGECPAAVQLKQTDFTLSVCPSKVRTQRPVETSHRRSVRSQLPDSAQRPSELKQTEVTSLVCPSNVRTQRPVETSHKQSVRSPLPDNAQRPSALRRDGGPTTRVCPSEVRGHNGPSRPPTERSALQGLPESAQRPSALKQTDVT